VRHARPAAPPTFLSSSAGVDDAILFKIIPVETSGAAPLYQIVPTGPNANVVRPPTVVASQNSNPSSITYTVTHDRPVQLTSAPPSQYQSSQPQTLAQHHPPERPPSPYHYGQSYRTSELRSSDIDPLRADDFLPAEEADLPDEVEPYPSDRDLAGPRPVQIEREEPRPVPNIVHSYQVGKAKQIEKKRLHRKKSTFVGRCADPGVLGSRVGKFGICGRRGTDVLPFLTLANEKKQCLSNLKIQFEANPHFSHCQTLKKEWRIGLI